MNQNRTFLPAEWAEQSGAMLTWPHPHGDWAPWLSSVEPVFVEIAYHIANHQSLIISCYNESHLTHVKFLLEQRGCDMNCIKLYEVVSNDSWVRDHGPITVYKSQKPQLIDFQFNGWGKKYESDLDNTITTRLHQQDAFADTTIHSANFVLEGGSIESDGKGTLLTTAQCLLTPTRNPNHSKSDIEALLSELLGVERFLWLNEGHLEGDDTDSHVDTLARLCDERTICYVSCTDTTDSHYTSLKAMEDELKTFKTASGEPYELVSLPMPKAIYNSDGIRLPATYANFLIINDAVLAPVYDDQVNDEIAIKQLKSCFPEREIIPINCSPLIEQFGSLHCVTMQLPVGVKIK